MANVLPRDLTGVPDGEVNPNSALIVDDGSGVFKSTPAQLVASGFPIASQPEAEAGTANNKAMTPQRVAQAINTLGVSKVVLESSIGGEMVGTANGSTVQQVVSRQPLQIDAYYESGDGDDWGPAFERAYAAGITQLRNLVATSGASYRVASSIDIWPNLAGWTPSLDLNGATITFGSASPTLPAEEYSGFRVRGVKSGALANSTGFKMKDGLFDYQNIHISNGMRGIWIENGSGWLIDNVDAVNIYQGYHFANWRYCDGGAVGTAPGIMRNCLVDGHVLSGTGDRTWYAYSEAGDLSVAQPGDVIADGVMTGIAMTLTGVNGTNCPKVAQHRFWLNDSGGDLTVPSTLTQAAIEGAGFTWVDDVDPGSGTPGPYQLWDGQYLTADTYMYYTTGGTKIADAVVQGGVNVMRDVTVNGSRYAGYVSGSTGAVFERVTVNDSVRGIAAEWGAKGVKWLSCEINDPLSSGILAGYGCPGWTASDCSVFAMSSRWVGEGLFNFQLSSGNGFGRRNRTNTRDNVTNGQYHVHIAVNSGNVDFEIDATGDCAKAYICVESAWNSTLTGTIPELYAGGAKGGASTDMANIRLSGSITPVSTKSVGTGATMIALLQIPDLVNGEIGLSRVDIENMRAGSSKIPVRYLKIYEGSTAAKQVNNCLLWNVEFPTETVPATAATRMILPRKWAHFRSVRNVSNLDDNVERAVPNVATPDLTFGKYWQDTSATALNGILGGQGASSSEGYEGREIVVRGNSSRAWTTVSATSGTKDGLRVTGSPITPTNVQRMVFRYNRTQAAWIGGLT